MNPKNKHADVLKAKMSVNTSLVVQDWSLKLQFGYSPADWLSHSSRKT